jgi:hypothetical protein
MPETDLLRPKTPMPEKPRGFMTLEHYSSLKRYWDFLSGFDRAGLEIVVPHRSPEDHCRRAIKGVRRENAGGILDVFVLLSAMNDDEDTVLASFNLEPETQTAVIELLAGNAKGVQTILSTHYTLEFDLQLALTSERSLVLKADTKYVPKLEPILPKEWPLRANRFGRDEYKMLLERASGALSRIPRP